jgi:hypothetical protein
MLCTWTSPLQLLSGHALKVIWESCRSMPLQSAIARVCFVFATLLWIKLSSSLQCEGALFVAVVGTCCMQEESRLDVLVGLGSWIEWQIVSAEISGHLRCCFFNLCAGWR